jgi:Ca2+-transporting ATPase
MRVTTILEQRGPTGPDPAWHQVPADEVAAGLGVDPAVGLPATEAAERLAASGPNRLEEAKSRPPWRLFVDQFRSLLIAVLAGAAVLAWVVGDLVDAVVIAVVLLANATIGFVQEFRAEQSLAALRSMLSPTARVRRDGGERMLPAEELVPGDVVLLEAGQRVPGDARVLVAAALEVDESALTGESQPVTKRTGALPGDVALGERTNLVFAQSVVTRGRGEALVVATGMGTEIGRIAGLLGSTEDPPTPLQRQLDAFSRRLAVLAGVSVLLYALVGLFRGEAWADLALHAVALAVAAIPEGLPAVVALTLAVGVTAMARRGAIVKRISSVETLGATTVICTDKTGTLTLNEMTARRVWAAGRGWSVSGSGYVADGTITADGGRAAAGADLADLGGVLRGSALTNDADVVDGELLGDPTDGALLVLAAKGGIDVARLRADLPRLAEVPFDSDHRLQATLHPHPAGARLYVKGAPDALLERTRALAGPDGEVPLDAARRAAVAAEVDRMADEGLRVLAVASRILPADAAGALAENLWPAVTDLALEGLVGLQDPPRTQAADAVAAARRAGIEVLMITGDHAATGAAIARQVGIEGEVLTGAQLAAVDDDALPDRLRGVGVVARVAPEHKLRIVHALQRRGEVVAMTGDGVNDAPALKAADIGVAMGTAGTEVAKEAATMVLTDDDFATIVTAVERGRGIYENVVKFVRFQLATNLGAIITVLGAQLVGLPAPFTALQVLWVNLIMDGPPALALGVDPTRQGIMDDPPRARGAAILPAARLGQLLLAGAVMAAGTLGVLVWGLEALPRPEALTLAFTTFVLFQIFNALNARAERQSALGRDLFRNRALWAALVGVVILQVAVVQLPLLERVFGTVPLAPWQWALAAGIAASILVVEELRKAVVRAQARRGER